jgi:hypothetical protein
MTTKPMKALVALSSVALLGTLVTASSAPAVASGGCELTPVNASSSGTAGTSSNPWTVSSAGDFALVGVGGCGLGGDYLQTASFSVDTSTATGRVDDGDALGEVVPFSGVYNGDHWQITLAEGSDRPPFSTVSGTIKKLQLGGGIVAAYPATSGPEAFADYPVGSLVRLLEGGTISEVGSVVNIQVSSANAAVWIGGLVGQSEGSTDLIQYSFFAGDLDIEPGGSGADIGGLIGRRESSGDLLIRDSYTRANVAYGTSGAVQAGGIVGNSNSRVVRFIRTYAAGSFEEKRPCGDCTGLFFRIGGLLGNSTDSRNLMFVSAFWLEPVGVNAVGGFGTEELGRNVQPSRYASGLPVAVGVNTQTLRTLSTFQSREDATTSGQPSGLANLTVASSTGTLAEQDYRWAIESANVETFVAQKRTASPSLTGETVTFTRAFDRLLWTNSAPPTATYSTRGVSETVDGYPDLGRVWEICASENPGFPVLVWEDRNCAGEGTGGGGNSAGEGTGGGGNSAGEGTGGGGNSAADQARAAGLSGAELTAFLASGLTLEQWLAQRLAATGTPGEALGLGVAIAGLLTMVGLSLLFLRRRSNVDPA